MQTSNSLFFFSFHKLIFSKSGKILNICWGCITFKYYQSSITLDHVICQAKVSHVWREGSMIIRYKGQVRNLGKCAPISTRWARKADEQEVADTVTTANATNASWLGGHDAGEFPPRGGRSFLHGNRVNMKLLIWLLYKSLFLHFLNSKFRCL